MQFEIRDSVKAIVSCCTSKGIYLEMENGENAYAVFNRLPVGTQVYCTVLKKATERWFTLVAIDSVVYRELRVAWKIPSLLINIGNLIKLSEPKTNTKEAIEMKINIMKPVDDKFT